MKHLINYQGQNTSLSHQLNLLWTDDNKIFVMDNHKGAGWSWAQKIEKKSYYSLVHIDRHFDLTNTIINNVCEVKTSHLNESINNLQNMTICEYGLSRRLLSWNNYISLFNQCFSNSIQEAFFFIHSDQDDYSNADNRNVFVDLPNRKNIFELSLINHLEAKNKIILNLDIDYFFVGLDNEEEKVEDFEDQLTLLSNWIIKNYKNIEVFTIALSPEYCNDNSDWNNSLGVLKQLFSKLNISSFPFDKI